MGTVLYILKMKFYQGTFAGPVASADPSRVTCTLCHIAGKI